MIHVSNGKGPRSVSFADLGRVPLKRPLGARSYWKGIPHHKLVTALDRKLHERGIVFQVGDFVVSADGSDFLAVYSPLACREIPARSGFDVSLGVLASNARRTRMKVYVGAVWKDGTSLVSDEVPLERLTINFDLDKELDRGLGVFVEKAKSLSDCVARLMKPIPTKEYPRILTSTGQRKILPWSRIGEVDMLFQEESETTAWNLLSCFSKVVRKDPVFRQLDELYRFYKLLVGE